MFCNCFDEMSLFYVGFQEILFVKFVVVRWRLFFMNVKQRDRYDRFFDILKDFICGMRVDYKFYVEFIQCMIMLLNEFNVKLK